MVAVHCTSHCDWCCSDFACVLPTVLQVSIISCYTAVGYKTYCIACVATVDVATVTISGRNYLIMICNAIAINPAVLGTDFVNFDPNLILMLC